MRPAWAVVLGVLLAIAVACSGKSNSTPERLCTPNANAICRCPDHSEGLKKCAADGMSFGDCLPCDGTLPDPDVQPTKPSPSEHDAAPPEEEDSAPPPPPPEPDAGPDADSDAQSPGPLCASLSTCCDQIFAAGNDATTCDGVVAAMDEDACNTQHEEYKNFGDCS